jgi:hypothetical protein
MSGGRRCLSQRVRQQLCFIAALLALERENCSMNDLN